MNNKTLKLYLNGTFIQSAEIKGPVLQNVTRKINYIGKSNWPSFANANGTIDDLKIFKRALMDTDILREMLKKN